MKRIITIAIILLGIVLLDGLPAKGQELDLTATSIDLPALGNRGLAGAAPKTGYLNTTLNDARGLQANFLSTFNTRDVAIGDFNSDAMQDIVAISADDTNGDGQPDTGSLVLFLGTNNGQFRVPLVFRTAGLPIVMAVADIDNDGISDAVVAERGFVEVFTGFFLINRRKSTTDRIGNPALPGGNALLPVNENVVSIALGRIDNDALIDVVIAEKGTPDFFEVFSTAATGKLSSTGTPFQLSGLLATFAPRSITVQQTNLVDTSNNNTVDTDLDVIVVSSKGIEIFENRSTNEPLFSAQPILGTGVNPVGVVAIDVNGDSRIDLITANRGTGTIKTFLALSSTQGYEAAGDEENVGQNPLSIIPINFNNDGRVDIAVVNAPSGGAGSSNISILTGIGKGLFSPVLILNQDRRLPVFNPQSIVIGRLDITSPTDDIVVADGLTSKSPGGVLYLSAKLNYNINPLQIFSSISVVADFDLIGGNNDVVFIEQGQGLIFILLNPTMPFPLQSLRVIDIMDLFTKVSLMPTSAVAYRDRLSNRNNIAITAVDINTSNPGTGELIIGLNGGGGITSFRQFVATSGATNLLSGDFNNDGADDLAYIDYLSSFAAVCLNNGSNSFIDLQFRETGGFIPVSAAIGDVNDDDNLDLVVANQGDGVQGNQSIVTVLLGRGDGRLVATGNILQVPNFVLSIAGGMNEIGPGGITRTTDFNNDGFPDFAVVSTRSGNRSPSAVPSVTFLLNRPDSPGNFTVETPILLVDDASNNSGGSLQLEAGLGGPGVVSGRFGDPSAPVSGVGLGGGYSIMAVSDLNADGFSDLVVTGTRLLNGINFRSSIYLIGNETVGNVRIVRPQRTAEYGGINPLVAGFDTFVACTAGRFNQTGLPGILHLSLNGRLFLDTNQTPVINQAPVVTIRRQDLGSPFPGSGRKAIVTAGQTLTIPVTGTDPDGDRLSFRLVPTTDGQQPPSFVTLKDNGNNTASLTIISGDINRGPNPQTFRIAIEATDGLRGNAGERQPLAGRAFFTLVLRPNTPPTISPIPNLMAETGKTTTVQLSINDNEAQKISTSVKCDKGNFVTSSGLLLTIAPQVGDLGTTTCSLTAMDEFGLSDSRNFSVTVVTANLPPTISSITDQTVRAGETLLLTVIASDPNGNSNLKLSLIASPSFVSLSDNGNGSGMLRIAPTSTDTEGGRVILQVTDPGGLTAQTGFNLTLKKEIAITSASFVKPILSISGSGFGQSGAKVFVNGKEVSSSIVSQSDSLIVVRGPKKRLNLKNGPNQVSVSAGGLNSNTFVLNLIK
jgi:hypothetical protein